MGGSAEPDDFPLWEPKGTFQQGAELDDMQGRVALIGHSAGGWISRIYLSQRKYGGKAYNGSQLVVSACSILFKVFRFKV